LVVLAGLPGLALLLRGVVWGSDSFAFWAVSCGQDQFGSMLSSPGWFVWFVENVISCNLWVLAFLMFVFYFFALLGIYFFGKRFFAHQAFRLPIYVVCLAPLFFIEALRFENDFFGWCLGFIALGCFSLFVESKDLFYLFFGVILACFSMLLWFPSVFIIVLVVFLFKYPVWVKYLLVIAILGAVLLSQSSYAVHSITQGLGSNAVSEEIPFVGLVFILHILHFWRKIPMPLTFYGILLLLLGVLKSKYMFLAVPLLIMGLMSKEDKQPLSFKREIFGIKKIPVFYVCFILGIGWFFMGLNMYPTQGDLNEMKSTIQLAKDHNVQLYNDWGDGWTFESLGYNTNYKSSPPNPDWNNLPRPFIAWSKEKIIGCTEIKKYTQNCN
jgi:hypothetical protein